MVPLYRRKAIQRYLKSQSPSPLPPNKSCLLVSGRRVSKELLGRKTNKVPNIGLASELLWQLVTNTEVQFPMPGGCFQEEVGSHSALPPTPGYPDGGGAQTFLKHDLACNALPQSGTHTEQGKPAAGNWRNLHQYVAGPRWCLAGLLGWLLCSQGWGPHSYPVCSHNKVHLLLSTLTQNQSRPYTLCRMKGWRSHTEIGSWSKGTRFNIGSATN